MTDLKPCPFCGGKAKTFHIPENTKNEMAQHPKWEWNFPGMWIVGCETPMCIGNLKDILPVFATEESAIEAWNRRASDDE